ncbi:hypothetical protein D3C73_938590 [compost metagenome]
MHRGFGFLDQIDRFKPVIGVEADAQAGGDANVMPGNGLCHADGGEQFFSEAADLLSVIDVGEYHHEFVGAIAKDRIRFSYARQQLLTHPLEHLVPGGIAQCVVDALETIQAEEHHHQLLVVTAGRRQGLGQAVTEQGAVGQVSECVVLQQVRNLEQLVDPRLDGTLQAEHFQCRVLGQLPFPGQGIGHLANFQGVERLFQNQQLVAKLQPFGHRLPAVVTVGGAQGNLQIWIGTPQLFDGFQSVPARWHSHVGERQGIGLSVCHGLLDHFQGFLTLIGRVELEGQV